MADAADLAARLMNGKPLTSARIQKLTKHLVSVAHYEAVLRELPEAERAAVEAEIGAKVRGKFA